MPKKNTPRISVNKLAEFITAKASRQRQILKDQKYPTDYKVVYYKEAAEAISNCIANNFEDLSSLRRQASILEQMQPEKVGTQRRVYANLDALESFEAMLDKIDFGGAEPFLGEPFPEKLMVHNVEISVRPEIILKGLGKKKKPIVGAAKLYFPKTYPLSDESAGYISAVLQEWCRSFMADEGEVAPALCCIIDVGAEKVWPGVKSTAQRLKDVQAYCKNIADLWQNITPSD